MRWRSWSVSSVPWNFTESQSFGNTLQTNPVAFTLRLRIVIVSVLAASVSFESLETVTTTEAIIELLQQHNFSEVQAKCEGQTHRFLTPSTRFVELNAIAAGVVVTRQRMTGEIARIC